MSKITWNQKAEQYLTPTQRDSYERGELPRRLDGKITTDEAGQVWFGSGELRKLVGSGAGATLADKRPAAESAGERDLDAPTGKPAKAKRKASPRKRK